MTDIIRIIADSGADIPKHYVDEYGLEIVPMHVQFNEETLNDGSFPNRKIIEFYEKYSKVPKTAAPNPYEFEEAYDRLHQENPDARLLYLAYSAVTTSTYQSASIAAQGRTDVTLLDTKQVSMGQGAVVLETARFLKEHPEASLEEVVKKAEWARDHAFMVFVPTNLDFLRAGGRVSNAAAMIGGLLGIHPVIEIKDGKLVSVGKIRGRMEKRMPELIETYFAREHLSHERVYLLHSIGLEKTVMDAVETKLKALGVKAFEWCETGGVITTHGGPAAIGLVGMKQD